MSESESAAEQLPEEREPAVVNNYRASVRAPRNVVDILAIDAEDESLRKYKEALLGSAAHGDLGDTSDPRRLVVTEFAVVFAPEESREPIVHSLDTEAGIAKLHAEGIKMKEGCSYKFKISFRVQHEIVPGIKFVHRVSKTLMSEEDSLMIGSYPPSSVPHVFEFPKFGFNEAPSGMLYRGKYSTIMKFIDSDGNNHMEIPYTLEVARNW